MTQKLVHVVAAVILNEQGEFLLSSRPEGKAYAGYWEFAGGKLKWVKPNCRLCNASCTKN